MRPLFVHDPVVVALVVASLVAWQVIQNAVSRHNSTAGRGSPEWSILAIVLIATASVAGSIVVAAHNAATIPGASWWPVIVGLILISLGMGFRTWAIVTLGRFFKLVVVVQEDHRIVEHGPYRRLRHPAYLGSTLAMVGFGMTEGDWLSVAIVSLGTLTAFAIRIRVEERVLLERLGAPYADYSQRTSRLIPGLY
jgi:protein-S-isoprenylcysteine O-methyltransferase Ste14